MGLKLFEYAPEFNVISYVSTGSYASPVYTAPAAPAYPIESSYAPIMSTPIDMSYSAPITGMNLGYSSPMACDSCFSSEIPMDTGILQGSDIPMGMGDGTVIDQGFIDGGGLASPDYSLDAPIDSGTNFGGDILLEGGTTAPGGDIYYNEGDNGGNSILNPGGGDSEAPVPPPGPDSSGDTQITRPSKAAVVLNVVLPKNAKVLINDRVTNTKGSSRSYVSRGLVKNRDYHYQVKAILKRDGKEVVRTRMVAIKGGAQKTVEFDFDSAPTTSLALKVPKDAKVTLCGKSTNMSGSVRYFETDKLEPGMTWKDYTVKVAVKRNGETVVKEKSINMIAGEAYSLAFDFDGVKDQMAAN